MVLYAKVPNLTQWLANPLSSQIYSPPAPTIPPPLMNVLYWNSVGTSLVLLTCAAIQVVYCHYMVTLCVECLWYFEFEALFEAISQLIEWTTKGQAMALKINVLRYNRVMFRQQSPSLWEKTGPICLVLVGLMAGWQANKIGMNCKIFKILYKLNYLDSYFI